jgi:L,D-transpeptidase-like protein
MSATATVGSKPGPGSWRTWWPPPALRAPQLQWRGALPVVLLMAGVTLASSGVTAVGAAGRSHGIPPATAEAVAINADAGRLASQYRGNRQGLLETGRAGLKAGRNDATIAAFLKLGWARRLSAALERNGAMLDSVHDRQLALGVAGVRYFASQIHAGLLRAGSGQLITVSLQAQELIAYDRGRVIVDTLVTTGRPALPTDIGAMQVVRKDAPWTMKSPWPRGSADWYPDTPVQMVVWFTKNGEGLHDASWQPNTTLGPGSQNGPYASHGCIHVPLAAVRLLFDWAPIGTPVVVYPGDGSPVTNQVAQQSVDALGNPTSGVRGD